METSGENRESVITDSRIDADDSRHVVIGIIKETYDSRVALVPSALPKLQKAGIRVLIESGAGLNASYDDSSYVKQGSEIVSREELLSKADVIVSVKKADEKILASLRTGQVLIGLLQPQIDTALVRSLVAKGVTAVSLDNINRRLSRAQTMDVLSSQANIAGYKSVLVAANEFGRYFPMLITAAGTAKPAAVLVLGAGVAGLQAMGTAKRLGAMVSGYDVRPETKAEVTSVGAKFIELGDISGSGEGGYARALSDEELAKQQESLNKHLSKQDVIITTAQVPGRKPPLLVTEEAIKLLKPGSVIVDIAASSLGGNVAFSKPNETVITENNVKIIGAPDLPSSMAASASDAFSNNLTSLLIHMTKEGVLNIDTEDEVQQGVVICHNGKITNQAISEKLAQAEEE